MTDVVIQAMNKYRFNQEINPDTGKKNHLHQLFKDGEWKNLTGASTATKVISKPLTYWAAGLAVSQLGWIKAGDWRKLKSPEAKAEDLKRRLEHVTPALETIKEMDAETYLALLDKGYKAHAEKLDTSAEAGTDLHAELERYVKYQMECKKTQSFADVSFDPKIKPFIEWTEKNVKCFLASEVHGYSEGLWAGGICDCVALLNTGELVIVDFKSHKDAYFTDIVQCAGYDLLLSENGGLDENGNLLMKFETPFNAYAVVPFGNPKPYPVVIRENLNEWRDYFRAALVLTRGKNKYENQ